MKLRKFITCLFIIFSALSASSQEAKIKADSTVVFGIVNEEVFLSNEIDSDCYSIGPKKLSKGTVVVVVGIENCYNNSSQSYTSFYEINHNSRLYFIPEYQLTIENYSFSDFNKLSKSDAEVFKKQSNSIANYLYAQSLQNAIKYLNSLSSKGLGIFDWSYYDESEYTEGTSVKISVYNPTRKTIKYLWFNFIGYNAVGDKVIDYKRKSSIIQKKAIGPITPDKFGVYDFKYAWFTDLVEKVTIASIKVQYMDGSVKTISNPHSIIIKREYKDLLDEIPTE